MIRGGDFRENDMALAAIVVLNARAQIGQAAT
jgi:hypothetical protein